MNDLLTFRSPTGVFNAENAKEQNKIGTEIKKARKMAGLKQSSVVESLHHFGIDIGVAALSRWEQGSNMPNPYQFLALCRVLGISNPNSLIEQTQGISTLTLSLNSAGIQKVKAYVADLESTGKYAPESKLRTYNQPTAATLIPFPVSTLKASAGTGQYLDDDAFETVDIPKDEIPSGADFGVYISGNSMTPRFQDGQLVFIKQTHELHDNEIGLFILDGEGFIKQFHISSANEYLQNASSRTIMLKSLNSAYPPKIISEESDFRIIGKVL